MGIRDQFLRTIHAFLAEAGMSKRQFGVEAVGDNKFVGRLENGVGINLTTLEKAEAYIDRSRSSQGAATRNSRREAA